MFYLLYGKEKYLIDLEIKKIIKNNDINEYSISKYDSKINKIDEIINDAISISLFGEKRLIIINCTYFSSEKSDEEEIKKLDNFLNTNLENIIVFIVESEKLDERKKITKLINKKAKVLEFNKDLDATEVIKNKLRDYKIDNKSITLIKEKLNNQSSLIDSELDKLINYKDDLNITIDDINYVISNYPNIDFFKFIDDIIKKNTKESIKTYEELLKLKEEPIKIIVTLANQFRLMYQAKKLYQMGYTEANIADTIKEHPYRVKLAILASKNYKDEEILDNLKKLGNIDLNGKKGLLDMKVALELFILGN